MLDGIFSSNFRQMTKDSFGGNYKFSWFVMDHIGYGLMIGQLLATIKFMIFLIDYLVMN